MALVFLALGTVCAGFAVLMFLSTRRSRGHETVQRVQAAIQSSSRSGLTGTDTDVSVYLDRGSEQSGLAGVAIALGSMFSGRLTVVSEEAIREQLISAGMYKVSPRAIIGYRVLLTLALPVLAYLGVGLHSLMGFAVFAFAIFAGWALPLTYVQRKARTRIETLDRGLPDLIDLLCVMIEAGLSFPQAMRMASEQFAPPLSDELRLTLQEQAMGLGIDEALTHMSERANTPAIKAFVRAMGQGERMGISMGQIMRSLSHEMRARRRSMAEERAQKTPVLMLFPLVFLIFPALFIILMTPAVINLVHNLKGF